MNIQKITATVGLVISLGGFALFYKSSQNINEIREQYPTELGSEALDYAERLYAPFTSTSSRSNNPDLIKFGNELTTLCDSSGLEQSKVENDGKTLNFQKTNYVAGLGLTVGGLSILAIMTPFIIEKSGKRKTKS